MAKQKVNISKTFTYTIILILFVKIFAFVILLGIIYFSANLGLSAITGYQIFIGIVLAIMLCLAFNINKDLKKTGDE